MSTSIVTLSRSVMLVAVPPPFPVSGGMVVVVSAVSIVLAGSTVACLFEVIRRSQHQIVGAATNSASKRFH